MTKRVLPFAAAMGFAALAAVSQPGLAQSTDSVSEIIVYGDDPCPRSTDDNVVVCARRPEAERYRIPERLREGGPRQLSETWVSKARQLETVSATGVNSCSPVGPGGFTGCLTQVINRAREQRGEEAIENTAPPEE
jgi:hypothetical protein